MRSNLPLLTRFARRLEPLLPELVFVGGATTELFFTTPVGAEPAESRAWIQEHTRRNLIDHMHWQG